VLRQQSRIIRGPAQVQAVDDPKNFWHKEQASVLSDEIFFPPVLKSQQGPGLSCSLSGVCAEQPGLDSFYFGGRKEVLFPDEMILQQVVLEERFQLIVKPAVQWNFKTLLPAYYQLFGQR
jgi:hypothetical protein